MHSLNEQDGANGLFDHLDQSQKNAVFHSHGPALVVAGPGSGKTAVILCRVWYLISQCRIPPEQILVLTFTKAAAKTLQSRLLTFTNLNFVPVSFGTFHSFFYQILRQYGSYKDFSIITIKEKQAILQELGISDMGQCTDILYAFSYRFNNTQADVKSVLPKEITLEKYEDFFLKYVTILKREKLLDFDQMAELTLKLLQDKPGVLSQLESRYQYVLVDEYQDTNMYQYEILKLLTRRDKNLFVVGDDDQAIYSFRGSSPGIMKQFQEDFHSVRVYYLSTNYRSAQFIVKEAGKLISQNKERLSKQIKAYSKESGSVTYRCFETYKEEYAYIADRLHELKERFPWRDMAVIGRTNRQVELIGIALESAEIPYIEEEKRQTTSVGVKKDLLELIHFVLGDKKSGRLWLAISGDRNRDAKFWTNKHPRLFLNYLIYGTGYLEYIRSHENAEEKEKELKVLLAESTKFKTLQSFAAYLLAEKKCKPKEDGIHLLTMHGAKGLEFSYVALIDINEGIVPGKACLDAEQFEEERRMLYVGMTRAKKILDVCYLKGTKEHPRFVSRFLNPLLGFEKED